MSATQGLRVLITGATGFVGSTLAHRLAGDGAQVRILARSSLGTDALQRRGAQILLGDLGVDSSLDTAVEGCDAVIHCAYSPIGELAPCREANVAGTLALLEAAERAGVSRFVHVSSAAVHGEDLSSPLEEDAPLVRSGPVYTLVKVEQEQMLFDFGERATLEVVAVRPTLVYGPGSWTWTTQPLHRLRNEEMLLIDGGTGVANLVYVADVAQALALAATVPGIDGEAYLVSGAQSVTWRDLLAGYAALLGKPAPESVSVGRARRILRADALRYRLLRLTPRLTPLDLRMQTQRHVVSIEKARRALGYRPEYDLERALGEIESWAARERLQPSSISF